MTFTFPLSTRSRKVLPADLRMMMLLAAVCIQACGGSSPSSGPRPETPEIGHETIAWFEGDVADAFALAESQGKPLFLYWGAEWCPPCHYLKEKLFTRQEFIARMSEFVPVYLDGDTERAQLWGEELAVQGYPTVIVFSPAGEEVMRLPSTLPVDRYQEVLDAAMASTRPVRAVLQDVMSSGPSSADASDLATLAFYSWDQDSSVELDATDKVSTFRRLYSECPAELGNERARFLTHYLNAIVELQRETPASSSTPQLIANESDALRREVLTILETDELRTANLAWLFYSSTATIDLLAPDPGAERTELIQAWQLAAADLETDSLLSVDDRLSALIPQVALARLESDSESGDWEAPEGLRQHVRKRVTATAEQVTDEGQLQATMSTMAYLLSSLGLEHEAEALLTARMNDAAAPYYFMSLIGGIKEDAGETEEALAWYRQAYDSSKGRYSRFRWGSMYLRHLLELAPDQTERIEQHSREVLAELLALEDAFSGGNYSRLQGLEAAYESWNDSGEGTATLDKLRELVHSACERYEAAGEDSPAARCLAFLADDGDIPAGSS